MLTRIARVLVFVGVVLGAPFVDAAQAAIVRSEGGLVIMQGDAGADAVTVTLSASDVAFHFSSVLQGAVLAEAPCALEQDGVFRCPLPAAGVRVLADAGQDTVQVDAIEQPSLPVQVVGGAGDDVLQLANGRVRFDGGSGTDVVRVTNAAGTDVEISLDDVGNDGLRGQRADIRADVENVVGGASNDTVVGNGEHNYISTQGGSDTIDGGGGFDDLSGGSGIDHIETRDGVTDRIECGDGFDSVRADTIDALAECEALDLSTELEPDADHDGFPRELDCDDRNAGISPGGVDTPGDGIDQDCDGRDAVILDADGDGIAVPFDCDDHQAAVHPGAEERYGNNVDENCNGRSDPYQVLLPNLDARLLFNRKFVTRVRAMRVRDVPPRTRVRLTCKGRGCPRKALTRQTSTRGADFTRALKDVRLRPGAVLTLTLSRSDSLTLVYTYRIRRREAPRLVRSCRRPDSGRTVSCEPRA